MWDGKIERKWGVENETNVSENKLRKIKKDSGEKEKKLFEAKIPTVENHKYTKRILSSIGSLVCCDKPKHFVK